MQSIVKFAPLGEQHSPSMLPPLIFRPSILIIIQALEGATPWSAAIFPTVTVGKECEVTLLR